LRHKSAASHFDANPQAGRAKLSGNARDIAANLIAAFSVRIERQRKRAEESIASLAAPTPMYCFPTAQCVMHCHVDRMILWAVTREIGNDPRSVRDYVAHQAAESLRAIIRNCSDTGGTTVSDNENGYAREIHTRAGTLRQIGKIHKFSDDLSGYKITGSSILLPKVTMPETLRIGAVGRPFGRIVDVSGKLGSGLANLIQNRIVERAEVQSKGLSLTLAPDLVRLADILDLPMSDMTGEH